MAAIPLGGVGRAGFARFTPIKSLRVSKDGAPLVNCSGPKVAGRGKSTRAIIRKLCTDFKYLKPDEYIDQTLHALANWKVVLQEGGIPIQAESGIFQALERVHNDFEKG